MKNILGLFTTLAIGLSANGTTYNSNYWQDADLVATKSTSSTKYFDQFLFGIIGDCSHPDRLWFSNAFSVEEATLGVDSQGRLQQASLSIQLFKDGSYWAQYYETAAIEGISGGRNSELVFEKKDIEGKWQVNGNKIILSGLGSGVSATYTSNGKQDNSFQFTLEKKINNPQALNSSMNMVNGVSNIGPRGVSISNFCGDH